MSRIAHLSRRRSFNDNTKWTPEEMLRAVADEMGDEIEAAVLVYRRKTGDAGDDGTLCTGFFRANVLNDTAVGMLEIARAEIVDGMRGRD